MYALIYETLSISLFLIQFNEFSKNQQKKLKTDLQMSWRLMATHFYVFIMVEIRFTAFSFLSI